LVLLGRIRDLSHYWHTSIFITPIVAGAFVTGCICTNALAMYHKDEHTWVRPAATLLLDDPD
jgi:hypothetical protein